MSKLPRITGVEAEFYNPYEHHKQNLIKSILFPKEYHSFFWDESLSVFWSGVFAIKLPDKPKPSSKKHHIEPRALPVFRFQLHPGILFAELSVDEGVYIHAADEANQVACMYDAKHVDAIRTKYPDAEPFMCVKTEILTFYLGAEFVGCVCPCKVRLTPYQVERIIELGYDIKYNISTQEKSKR